MEQTEAIKAFIWAKRGNEPKQPCSMCTELNAVRQVKKEGPNKGRPFFSCWKCEAFNWVDMPVCSSCGQREYEARAKKKGPNEGRAFRSCPGQCSFSWTEPAERRR